MHLYLVRHGKAHRHADSGRDDDRTLKHRGERQAAFLGEALGALEPGARPALILSSPITRALQTARILENTLALPLQIEQGLSTRAGEDDLLALVRTRQDEGPLAVVGHNPTLESAVSRLLKRTEPRPPAVRTGMCVVIEFAGRIAPGAGTLVRTLREPEDDDDE